MSPGKEKNMSHLEKKKNMSPGRQSPCPDSPPWSWAAASSPTQSAGKGSALPASALPSPPRTTAPGARLRLYPGKEATNFN